MVKTIYSFLFMICIMLQAYSQPIDMNRLLPNSSRFIGGSEDVLTGFITKSVGNFAPQGGGAELIISEPFNDRVIIIVGKQNFPQKIDLRENFLPKITVTGHEGSAFGISVSAVGDFNNDGWNDIAIGAPFDGETGSEGRIYILKGTNRPQPVHVSNEEAFALIIEGQQGEQLGQGIGDGAYFNDDSFTDFPIYNTTPTSMSNQSRAYLVYGGNSFPEKVVSTNTIPQENVLSIVGPDEFETRNEHFSSSFEFVGDMNNDEFPELALSLGVADDPPQARLLLLQGGSKVAGQYQFDNIPLTSWQYNLSLFNDVNQHSITSLRGGDLNNDGLSDIVAGFAGGNLGNATAASGAVTVIPASENRESITNISLEDLGNATLLTHWVSNSGLGNAISTYQDNLALGVSNAYSPFAPEKQTGAVYVINGNQLKSGAFISNLAGISSVIFYGRNDGDQFGESVDYVGDYNRNGLHDFLIGSPGNVDSDSPSAYLNQYRPRFFDPNGDGILNPEDAVFLGAEWKQQSQTSDFTNDEQTNEEDLLQLLLRLLAI